MLTIPVSDMWQTTSLDEAVAEEFFGWKWIAYMGVPIRGTPGYPTHQMVREFLPPEALNSKRWGEFLKETQARDAMGDEPLAYCYCSSQGHHFVPHFSGHANAIVDLEKELRKRKLWDQYRKQLWVQVTEQPQPDDMQIDEARLADADCEMRCIAALAVVGSRFVEQMTS